MNPYRWIRCIGYVAALGWIACGCSRPTENSSPSQNAPQTVLLFAAASTTNAVEEINTLFEKETGIQVKTNFASSSVLAQQIASGANAGVFLSANQKWANFLDEKKLTRERMDLLGNRLVLIVPANSTLKIEKPEDLLNPVITHFAVAEPDSVPAGIYAKQALSKLNLWDSVNGKTVRGSNVRQTLMYVERGEAEVGAVYATDAAISQTVRVVYTFDSGLTDPISYPLVLLKNEEQEEASRQLYHYLASPHAQTIFQKYGFSIITNDK